MIDREHIIRDSLTDEIGLLLKRLEKASPGRDREGVRQKLVDAASEMGYVFFVGHYRRYNLNCIGDSYLYRVPDNKRGNLKTFRGKLVRVSCWHRGGQFDRKLMAGIVGEDQVAGPLVDRESAAYYDTKPISAGPFALEESHDPLEDGHDR